MKMLILEFFVYRKSLQFQYFVLDLVSVVSGLIFCCVSFWGKTPGDDIVLQELLLNVHSSVVNGEAESKEGDGENPYASAGIFSILTFSWTVVEMEIWVAFAIKRSALVCFLCWVSVKKYEITESFKFRVELEVTLA
ncbi:hypothetical protein ACFE04_003576 [Oxalis oulophora]